MNMFLNRYEHCNEAWEDEADSMCNDKCPVCNKEIEPFESEEMDEGPYDDSEERAAVWEQEAERDKKIYGDLFYEYHKAVHERKYKDAAETAKWIERFWHCRRREALFDIPPQNPKEDNGYYRLALTNLYRAKEIKTGCWRYSYNQNAFRNAIDQMQQWRKAAHKFRTQQRELKE